MHYSWYYGYMIQCSVEGCEAPRSAKAAKGMCSKCYMADRGARLGPCSADGCGRPSDAKGLCSKHYYRFRTYGSTEESALKNPHGINSGNCAVATCEKKAKAGGYCSTHYARFKLYGSTDDAALQKSKNFGSCSVDGCDEPMRKRTWCATHYSQWQRLGEVKPLTRKWTPKGMPCAMCGGVVAEESKGRKFCSPSCEQVASRYNYDRPTEATCVSCERPFSLARRDGRFQRTDTKWCRDCRRTGPDARRYRLYGVTQKWYEDKATSGCSICGVTDRNFHVDHDHKCCPGKQSCGECVRGLLCGQCNQALGLLGDSTEVLGKAIEYLNK